MVHHSSEVFMNLWAVDGVHDRIHCLFQRFELLKLGIELKQRLQQRGDGQGV